LGFLRLGFLRLGFLRLGFLRLGFLRLGLFHLGKVRGAFIFPTATDLFKIFLSIFFGGK
jgi:hypothetical protein